MKLVIRHDSSIRKKVYHHIREQILRGEIVPGERLVEAKIAREIGTSRTPVREALHSLEIEKLISSIPRVGYVVSAMSESEVEQICEIRAAIEALAARWALAKAPARLIRELGRILARQGREVEKGNLTQYVELDAQFHEVIARLSGSNRLLELSETLRRHMLRYRVQCIHVKETAERSMKGHERILAAFERGEPEEVGRAIQEHLADARHDILYFVFQKDDMKPSRSGRTLSC